MALFLVFPLTFSLVRAVDYTDFQLVFDCTLNIYILILIKILIVVHSAIY